MIYTTGTIAGNGSTITGNGTNFTAAGSLIRAGCTLIAFTNPVQVLQLAAITNGTSLSVTPAISPTIAAGTRYAILLSDSLSVDGLAQDIAETFSMYQKYMGGFADVMNGTGDVAITINGTPVTVPGQKSLAKKGANSDITSLSGLTTPLSLSQGGLGAKDSTGGRAALNLGNSATRNALSTTGDMLSEGDFGVGDNAASTDFTELQPSGFYYSQTGTPSSGVYHGVVVRHSNTYMMHIVARNSHFYGKTVENGTDQGWAMLYTEKTTTKAADGTLKAASPVVKLFANGNAETNDESEGITVTRQSVGEYLIEGCMGLNADAAWGGIDGGFDIPKDRNRQALIWLDYTVNPDGSILVKTFHRTHPGSPAFARNLIGVNDDAGVFTETVKSDEPIDIPADQFVSVRVEMPQNSIWNLQQAAAQKAMEEAERIAAEKAKEEAERAATEGNQPESE